jgi:hypothetical protein
MWIHVDEADYLLARCGVATAARPQGPFTYQGSFRPHGQMCRDMTVFQVSVGTGGRQALQGICLSFKA